MEMGFGRDQAAIALVGSTCAIKAMLTWSSHDAESGWPALLGSLRCGLTLCTFLHRHHRRHPVARLPHCRAAVRAAGPP